MVQYRYRRPSDRLVYEEHCLPTPLGRAFAQAILQEQLRTKQTLRPVTTCNPFSASVAKSKRVSEPDDLLIEHNMKYLLILLACSATSLHADTYQGKNGKVAHNRAGTAVQTSNGTAVHARGSSTVRSTNGAYHAGGTNGTTVHTNRTTIGVHTNSNWNSGFWSNHQYGYWNGQRGYWKVTSGNHVFVVVN
jgi:hypothetical protein